MKRSTVNPFFFTVFGVLIGCGNCNGDNKMSGRPDPVAVPDEAMLRKKSGVVGEWEQQYSAVDSNGNSRLEPGEKIPSGTHRGFNWFQFNSDGSCLGDKDKKFRGAYTIRIKGETRKLVIYGGMKLRYDIVEITQKELILGTDGIFIVFKRIM